MSPKRLRNYAAAICGMAFAMASTGRSEAFVDDPCIEGDSIYFVSATVSCNNPFETCNDQCDACYDWVCDNVLECSSGNYIYGTCQEPG